MFSLDFAIKFGSNEIIISRKGMGIIAKEPAFLAVTPVGKSMRVRAVGVDAQQLYLAKTNNVLVYQPIINSEVQDIKLASILVSEIVKKCIKDKFFLTKLNALVAVPCALNQKQLTFLKKTLHSSGFSKLTFVQNGVCARAFHDNLTPNDMAMFVDIGKYITDISVLNDSNFFTGRNFLIGGNDMDMALCTYVKDNYDLDITLLEAERIKNEIGSLYSRDYFSAEVVGINEAKQYKKQVLTATEVKVAITNVYEHIFKLIADMLNELPNEIKADIHKSGIYFCGGVANISGLYEFAKENFDFPIIVDEYPAEVVMIGANKLMHKKEHIKINI